MTKPLARWTIGPVSSLGFDILKTSVKMFADKYPEFDRVVCFNHIDRGKLYALDAELIDQHSESQIFALRDPDSNGEEASGCGWKLVPPRLRPDAHELWIDNDIVIMERIATIDQWLGLNTGIISSGIGRNRMYGRFDKAVPDHLHLCAGLFGLPPQFDFERAIFWAKDELPLGGYDEQGLTTSIVTSIDGLLIVPPVDLLIVEDVAELPSILPKGLHFVGANRKPWHRAWSHFLHMTGARTVPYL